MNTSFSVSIKDIYGTNDPEIPKGWEATEFRIVKEGEYFLGPRNQNVCQQMEFYLVNNLVRIILRKKTERKFEKIVSSCLECPHCVTGINLIGCGATRPITFFHNVASIPDWCPLPKN